MGSSSNKSKKKEINKIKYIENNKLNDFNSLEIKENNIFINEQKLNVMTHRRSSLKDDNLRINIDFSEKDKEKIIKQFLFLTAQLEDLKGKKDVKNNNEIEFYLINETLDIYNPFFIKINDVYKYIEDLEQSKLVLKELKSNFPKLVSNIIRFCPIKEEIKLDNLKNKNISQLDWCYSNNEKYPENFFLIEKCWLCDFIEIFDEKKENFETNLKKGIIFENYIIIENIKDSQYFACSIKNKQFIVDFIFFIEKSGKKDEILSSIKDFLKNNKNDNNNNLKNKKINLNNEKKEIIGFVICYPVNDIKKKEEEKYNQEIYNKIKKYFSLNAKYKEFLLSFNKIKNNTINNTVSIDELEKIISKQKETMEEFIVYAVNENDFKKIIERIYFNVYDNHCKFGEKEKKDIINILLHDEKKQKKNLNDLELKRLLYDNCLSDINNKICLINIEFYNSFINKYETETNDYEINFLKINNENYLYFNKKKQYIKIYEENKIDSNIWSFKPFDQKKEEKENKNVQNINNQEIIEEKGKEKEKEKIREKAMKSIIRKAFLLYHQRNEINIKKDNKDISLGENYSLINAEWLSEYKKHYDINKIIKTFKNININLNKNYEEYKLCLEKDIQEKDFSAYKIQLKDNHPEKFKDSNLLPQRDSEYNYPIHFEIIKNDLFNLLIKEDNINDNNNKLKDMNNYNIIVEENIIILKNNSKQDNNIFIYTLEGNNKNKDYIIKYIFKFNNNIILKEQFNNILNNRGINNYISTLGLDLTEKEQNIPKIGTFINFYPDKLTISSFKNPPLIGLVNVGATCYMNATLQCFSNIDLLTDFILINKDILKNQNKYDLGSEYSKVIVNLWNKKIDPKKKFYEPNDFKKKIGEKNPLFSGIAANDSKDLIMFILEELHKELNRRKTDNSNDTSQNSFSGEIQLQTDEKEEYSKFSKDYYSKNESIIQKLFYGEQESYSLCHNCKIKIFTFSIFNFLIFPLEKVRQFLINNNNYNLGYVTLYDCFLQYISIEKMTGQNQMYCNSCHQNSDFSMSNIIFKHPEIFIIILNRGKGLEFQVPFKYPKSFDLNDFMNMNNNNDNYKNNEKIEYELISVITHIGESSMSGHFIACCKSPVDNKWYCYNDAIVSECKDPINIFGANNTSSIPYVLFYQYKNINKKEIKLELNTTLNESTISEPIVILYFKFKDGKELYVDDARENTIFSEVIQKLFKKYKLNGKYEYLIGNKKIIDCKKTIKENEIKNEDKIIAKKIK